MMNKPKYCYSVGNSLEVVGRFAGTAYLVGRFHGKDWEKAFKQARRVEEAHKFDSKSIERWNMLCDIAADNKRYIGEKSIKTEPDLSDWIVAPELE